MKKFFALGIILLSMFLGFTYLSFLSEPLIISFQNYQIELSALTAAILFLSVQIIILVCYKILRAIFWFPHHIKTYFNNRSIKKTETKMNAALENHLLGFKQQAESTIRGIYNKLNETEQNLANIIILDSSKNQDEKIDLYQKMLFNKERKFYAHKKLAQTYLEQKEYKLAEKHAIEYFDYDDKDEENILTLMNIYSASGEREKLLFLVSKIDNFESEFWQKNVDQIVMHLTKVAKELVANSEEDEAKKYLENALEIKPDHLDSLKLYSEIAVNNKNTDAISAIAKAAFNYAPSFEVAKIYADNAGDKSPQEIYNDLASLAPLDQNRGTFLAISAYLGLDHKNMQLKI